MALNSWRQMLLKEGNVSNAHIDKKTGLQSWSKVSLLFLFLQEKIHQFSLSWTERHQPASQYRSVCASLIEAMTSLWAERQARSQKVKILETKSIMMTVHTSLNDQYREHARKK